ncbi:hypothetical protein AB1Y20_005320 [Prymnesium parvum]|uniref:Receptor ligand binding region domain-containing protein n=1 Tax=Prymnesium parvum TaxID=97485 RepID=A0AB34J664_PRYPA
MKMTLLLVIASGAASRTLHRSESPPAASARDLQPLFTPRATLAVFTLVRGGATERDLQTFVNSRLCLRDAMPAGVAYDNIAFLEHALPPRVQAALRRQTPRLRLLDVREYGGFDASLLPIATIADRHASHFMSMLWFVALGSYEHALRVDEDVCLTRLSAASLAAAMAADYAHGALSREAHDETVRTFGPWLGRHMAAARLTPTLRPLPSEEAYRTHLFLSRVRWWTTDAVGAFLGAVNRSGGVYTHRWADAPIHTAAVRLHGGAGAVVRLDAESCPTQQLWHGRRRLDNASASPPPPPPPPPAAACVEGCCDTPSIFATVAVCAGGAGCAEGVSAAVALVGSEVVACHMSVAQVDGNATAFGCPLAFNPPVDRETLLLQLCPESCALRGFPLAGCTRDAPPPAPPTPPLAPPLPPLVPAPANFTTIGTVGMLRAALAAAAAAPLFLYLPEGLRLELRGVPLVLSAGRLHLLSEGAGATIDAAHASQVFELRVGASLTLDTITLANARTAFNGGAIAASGARLSLRAVRLVNCSAAASGGAIFLSGASVAELANTTILHTAATVSGGAIMTAGGSSCTLRDGCVLFNTTSFSEGGALFLSGGAVYAYDTSLLNSTGQRGGALYTDAGTITLVRCVVLGAASTRDGGAVFVTGGSVVLLHTHVLSSRATWSGGAAYLRSGSLSVGDGCRLADASASLRGGLLFVAAGEALVSAAELLRGDAPQGGAVFVSGGALRFTRGAAIADASAEYGGAFYIDGGSIHLSNASVRRATVSWAGGGAYIAGGSLELADGSSLSEASSSTDGGGVHIGSGTLTLRRSTLSAGHSVRGGCLAVYGGEVRLEGSVLERCTSLRGEGLLVYVPAETSGAGPLVLVTASELRQAACAGSLMLQQGKAQFVLRNVTFTPLDGCDLAAAGRPAAFPGVAPLGCGEAYVDRQLRAWGVCSLAVRGACAEGAVEHLPLTQVSCACPAPEFIVDPALDDAAGAPYLQTGGCVVQPNAVVRIGVLLPMFGPDYAGSPPIAWSPQRGAYQALAELNDKGDGVADELLPHTQLWLAFRDSKCDSTYGLTGALHLTQNSFDGQGVRAIIGAGCSAASIVAAQIATASHVPIISPVSVAPELSDGQRYPYFLRLAPAVQVTTAGMVDVALHLLKYSRLALVYSLDEVGEGAGIALRQASLAVGLVLSVSITIQPGATDFAALRKSRSRAIFLVAPAATSAAFLKEALAEGIGGEGYLWFLIDPLATDASHWADDPPQRERALNGSFALYPFDGQGTSQYDAFRARQARLPLPADGECSRERDDDDAAYLWGEERAGGRFACAEHADHFFTYDTFAYDAIFAVAHALHELFEVRNRTDADGAELLDALTSSVSFDGLTGPVSFTDGLVDPVALPHGDRRTGHFLIANLFAADGSATLVGNWTPCVTSPCEWADRWRGKDVPLTFSTANNSKPPQQGSCPYGQVLTDAEECVCRVDFYFDVASDQCLPCPEHTSSAGGVDAGCDVCAPGRYLRSGYTVSTDGCGECPSGAECPWNSTLATLAVKPGYWRLSTLTTRIYACVSAGANRTSCAGGTESDSLCAPGHDGPLCEVCLDNNYHFEDGYCKRCPNATIGVVVLTLVCLLLFILSGTLYFVHEQTWSDRLAHYSASFRQRVHASREFVVTVGLIPKIKLALTFTQVISALEGTYSVGLPDSWFEWTVVFRVLGELNWLSWVVPPDCIVSSSLRVLLLRTLTPLAVVVIMPLLGVVYGVFKYAWAHQMQLKRRMPVPVRGLVETSGRRSRQEEHRLSSRVRFSTRVSFQQTPAARSAAQGARLRAKLRRCTSGAKHLTLERQLTLARAIKVGVLRLLPTSLVLAFCFTPSVSANIFRVWHCERYEYAPFEERLFLASDLSVRCDDSSEYDDLIVAAWVLIAIWPVGMVALYLGLLVPCRHQILEENTEDLLVRATKFLHRDYKTPFFWWEVASLIQRTTLTGWLLLIDSELRFIRLLAGLVVSISFLIVLLALKPYKRPFDYMMAAGCQILFVCIFVGGIIVRLYEDIAKDSSGGPELAYQFLGLQSSEHIIVIMILVAFSMLALLMFTLVSESYAHFIHQRLMRKWSVCTMNPPYMHWRTRGIYACFLSHYKMEAASDARYMHDMLRKMLQAPVFLDSSALNDLRNLITEGVHKSDTLVLLMTRGVLSRPWCLLELFETAKRGIPVVIVQMANNSLSLGEARYFVNHLETEMERINPTGLQFLHEKLGMDLSELKHAVHMALDANHGDPIIFGSHAGDNAMLATMKDVVERMAAATHRKVEWKGEAVQQQNEAKQTSRSIRRFGAKFSLSRLRRLSASFTKDGRTEEVHNEGSAIFICCAREDAASHARVLRSELQVKLGRACAIGGGARSARWIDESQMVVVLLTKQLLSNPIALFEAWQSIHQGLPVVTVAITGNGYDYQVASAVYLDLPSALDAARPGAADELQDFLPTGVSVAQVGEQLHATLTAIIALAWSPAASKNQLGALVDDIISRMPKRKLHAPRILRSSSGSKLRSSLVLSASISRIADASISSSCERVTSCSLAQVSQVSSS